MITAAAAALLTRVRATLVPGSMASALRQQLVPPSEVVVVPAVVPPERLITFQPAGQLGTVAEAWSKKSRSRSCARAPAGMTGGVVNVVPPPVCVAIVPALRTVAEV